MINSLSLEQFRSFATDRRVIPVARQFELKGISPVAIYRQLAGDRPGTFLLESAESGVWSRWSFIGVKSAAHLISDKNGARWHGKVPVGLVDHHDPKVAWQIALQALHTTALPEMPPLTGGLVGAIGYDFVRRLENLQSSPKDDRELPESVLLLATDMAAIDHETGTIWLIANAINFDNTEKRVDESYQDCLIRLDQMSEQLDLACELDPLNYEESASEVVSQTTQAHFLESVETAKEHIRAGDAFQIVLAQRFDLKTHSAPLDIYRVLRETNPSPYMYLLRLPDSQGEVIDVVGASPEALVRVTNNSCLLHPIAGTRPRGKNPEEDKEFEIDLLSDEKERAEHLMLVDLGRNDLGRVSMPGSVRVTEFMNIERYSHVMHIVSTITSQLSESKTALDALTATFPAGTLSGAPKPRAMQIIDRLEPLGRGFYGGCVGYFDFAGNLDMAIAIRTAVIKDGLATVQAGAGIVADSDPAAEFQECKNKAAAIIRAISMAPKRG